MDGIITDSSSKHSHMIVKKYKKNLDATLYCKKIQLKNYSQVRIKKNTPFILVILLMTSTWIYK